MIDPSKWLDFFTGDVLLVSFLLVISKTHKYYQLILLLFLSIR